MSLRMADGPVAHLPAGFDAYGGYVNHSGIGVTYPDIVAKFPSAIHFSITTNGSSAMCADVEKGAMSSWVGYPYGYCSISDAQSLIGSQGRPAKLWTAHYTNVPHICSPTCGFGFTGYADGTQWTSHNNTYDESLLLDNFFSILPPPPTPQVGAMAVSPVFEFKPNQLDTIQVGSGQVWHKYNQGTGWKNEAIGVAGVTYVGQPQVAVLGGAVWVTVEDSNGREWTFLQTAGANTWANSELP